MMKKKVFNLIGSALLCSTLLTSCYTYTSVVGQGGNSSQSVTKWNHYLLFGLAPVDVSDSKAMAGGSSDYTVTTKQTFVNGLIAGITFGLYTPTTTTVKK
jgi:predicted small secreted protein